MGTRRGLLLPAPGCQQAPSSGAHLIVGSRLRIHFALGFLEEQGLSSFFKDKQEVGGRRWFIQTRVTTWAQQWKQG